MITSLNIEGFKSICHCNIDFAQLTVLTGLNSSGKSTIVQAVRILEKVAKNEQNPLLEGYGSENELKNEAFSHFELKAYMSESENCISYPKVLSEDISLFPKVIYISADRKGPRVSIPVNNSPNLDECGDNVVKCIEEYNEKGFLPEGLDESEDPITSFSQLVEYWLKAISPNISFRKSIVKEMDSSFVQFNNHRALNVGFGLSYTLPVIVAILMGVVENNSIVIIENPEAHIHPQGQTKIASLICRAVDAGAQILVETHSDHLIDGMRIYAKGHPGFSSKMKMYWLELDSEKRTNKYDIFIDDNGRYKQDCPKGFSDQFEINASNLLF